MRGIDTNVLLRLLLRDDEAQAKPADALVETACSAEAPCLINRIVLIEAAWVLGGGYGYTCDQVAAIIENILRTEVFVIEGTPEVWSAVQAFHQGQADFADCLIGKTNRAHGCTQTATFDRAAAAMDAVTAL